MKNFKEIAEKCLAGELKGTFKLASGKSVSSDNLKIRLTDPSCKYPYQMYVDGVPLLYTIHGTLYSHVSDSFDIIDFISDNMKEQIKIDIPEGKIPVMKQTENGVVITWKEKVLTYNDIYHDLVDKDQHVSVPRYCNNNCNSRQFSKKVEVLRKLTNIRNYFGKPDGTKSGYYIYESDKCGFQAAPTGYPGIYANGVVAFKERKHAEQAIKMLGDELKYLFEPW